VDLVNYTKFIEIVRKNGEANTVKTLLKTADPTNVPKIVEDLFRISDNIEVKSGEDIVRSTMKAINNRVNNPDVQGIEIKGFPTLNHTLLGWNPNKLILLSGNSGHGKTTVACNFINNLVDDYRCLFFSLEMTQEEIMEKIITMRSGVPSSKIATGSLEQFEYDKVVEASSSLMHGNLQIVTGDRDLYKIVAVAKALIMRRKIRFVFIDYVQLITMKSRADRWEQLAEITKTLKNQICSLGVTVIALTQLKRSALQSDIPDANEQAGAYAMVADSDVAIAVRKQDPSENNGSNFLINVSKNRFGWDEVQIPCDFDRTVQTIKEINA
jgi:replicative DNA helicase